ncbi:MAG: YbhB/YbcL family Raf kinase inhibitor-like protein [Cyanobacteria bacterium SID2]|nr:YbhB/YbcL family Raf kinase inhibitor-like protein [Cyanobacteria bacterium SID2]
MISRRRTLKLFALAGLTLTACEAGDDRDRVEGVHAETPTMNLTSSAFAANDTIPRKYTCDGANLSPPLSWNLPPEGTESLALIVDDPDAPVGTFVHWVLYNLSPNLRELPEGVAKGKSIPEGGTHGKNDFKKLGYGGPCPPGGTHRYFFKLYALDSVLDLEPGVTKAKVVSAMEGHVLGYGELMVTYQRQG